MSSKIIDAVGNLIDIIPDSHDTLKMDLYDFLYHNLFYKSPEQLASVELWNNLCDIIYRHIIDINDTNEIWKKKCIDITNITPT
jgi:hypothetical protein